jgi:hypothetical protein
MSDFMTVGEQNKATKVKARKISYGAWRAEILCYHCEYVMSDHEKMYSGGICPNCGYDDESTVCDTVNKVVRPVYEHHYFLGFIPYRKLVGWEDKNGKTLIEKFSR